MHKWKFKWLVAGALLALVFFCAAPEADAQFKIVINNADSTATLVLKWDRVMKDTLGGPERVVEYRVYESWNGHVFNLIGYTEAAPGDTTTAIPEFVLPKLVVPGRYVYGIEAVDAAGNRSIMHKSTSPTAWNGGWALEWDLTPPMEPGGVRPEVRR